MASNFPKGKENSPSKKGIAPKDPAVSQQKPDTSLLREGLNAGAQDFTMPPQPFTQYQFCIPPNHPPYENPINGLIPLHFDSSCTFDVYTYPDGRRLLLESEFEIKLRKIGLNLTPKLLTTVAIHACTTSAARATVGPDAMPEASPPTFCIGMFADQSHRWAQIYDVFKSHLAREYPISEYPECYPMGEMVIRFFLNEEDQAF